RRVLFRSSNPTATVTVPAAEATNRTAPVYDAPSEYQNTWFGTGTVGVRTSAVDQTPVLRAASRSSVSWAATSSMRGTCMSFSLRCGGDAVLSDVALVGPGHREPNPVALARALSLARGDDLLRRRH